MEHVSVTLRNGYAIGEELRRERAVADRFGRAWNCDLRAFGTLSPIDYYACRDGAMVAVAEVKCRTNASTTYPTVFLSVRKWLALTLCRVAMNVPALFVVGFTDQVRWVNVGRVDASKMLYGGRTDRGLPNDTEPLIEVPVASMAVLP